MPALIITIFSKLHGSIAGRFLFTVWQLFGKLLSPLLKLLTPITWLLRPVWWLIKQLGRGMHAFWRFLGRIGIVLRHLLSRLIWKPFLFIASPIHRLYQATIHRFVLWLGGKLRHALSTAIHWIRQRLQVGWQRTFSLRYRLRRRLRSEWALFRAKWRVKLRRIGMPATSFYAEPISTAKGTLPPHLRLIRIGSLLIAINVLLVGLALSKKDNSSLAFAGMVTTTPTKITQPTVTPSSTPVQTPIPSPTLDPAPWPTPNPLGTGGSVVFAMKQAGNQDIYAISIGQQEPIRLTNHPANDRDPAWSPDGSKVAFASQRSGNWDIYILDLRDGALTQLTIQTGYDANPSWSPDGEWLVYESYQNENLDVYVVNVVGGKPIRLTEHESPDFAPAWSPDGRHVAFSSWRSGNKDIFIRALDQPAETATINVTFSPDRQEDNPAFNAEGESLAFDDDSEGFDLVYTLPLLEYMPADSPTLLGQGKNPDWSPDGQAMVYIHQTQNRSYLIADSVDTWSVAPQAFAGIGDISSPKWTSSSLPRNLNQRLATTISQVQQPLYRESAQKQSEGATYLLNELPVLAPAPYLNDRVDDSFSALRQRVIQEAGWDFLATLDNLFVSLDSAGLPGQNPQTWNKAGRAFDLESRSVLSFDPQVEVVREDRGNEIYWRVYIRAKKQDGSQGEPLRTLPWDFRARYGQDASFYDQGGKLKDEIPTGYYVDFTALAEDYGWMRVPADEAWRTFYPGIRFWHFEKRDGLTWEAAMQELYGAEELQEILK